MKIKTGASFLCVLLLLVWSGSRAASPYYFIAIHNEPYHGHPAAAELLPEAVSILKEMVAKADGYHIKLTIMLSPEWDQHLTAEDISAWKLSGHEIASHHHSVYHPGGWDGYTGIPLEEALQIRESTLRGRPVEETLGDLSDYMARLFDLDAGVVSGCLNEEPDKREMPDEIIYPTCSGYSNAYKTIGQKVNDMDSQKAINEFIVQADLNGITRNWLAHAQIIDTSQVLAVMETFKTVAASESTEKVVFGTVNHSAPREHQNFNDYLDLVHSYDSTGAKSRTISEIMNSNILPVEGFVMKDNREMERKVTSIRRSINKVSRCYLGAPISGNVTNILGQQGTKGTQIIFGNELPGEKELRN
ncbi:MAG: hypothetical protein HQK83_19730 [Fibrobacteria bacterium]|nr:hypothetical protein [Fibrobacteria bacterium]